MPSVPNQVCGNRSGLVQKLDVVLQKPVGWETGLEVSWQKSRDWLRYIYGRSEYVWTLVAGPGLDMEGLNVFLIREFQVDTPCRTKFAIFLNSEGG